MQLEAPKDEDESASTKVEEKIATPNSIETSGTPKIDTQEEEKKVAEEIKTDFNVESLPKEKKLSKN